MKNIVATILLLTSTAAYANIPYDVGNPMPPVALSGAYSDLTGAPALAPVATSGSYTDLTSKPTIPAAQVNTDWNSGTGLSQILNKPSLATVATSGSYLDLINTPSPVVRSFNNTPSHPIQTVAASANGYQLSTTRDSMVSYSVLETVTSSITSGQSGYVVLEICSTNSSTAANWIEINRISSSQVYSLAIALQGVQGAGNPLTGMVPAGYFARMRSINVTGSPTYAFISGQEILL